MNLPNWLYYIIITISGLCQFLILYNSAANLKASIVIVSIAVMAVLSACALLRSKHVKVSFTLKDLE